jgi:serine/threonine protein kinase
VTPEDPTEAVPTRPVWEEIPAHRPLLADDPREVGGYRLRARLGEGGMGRVYLSYTPGGRPVAIKVIRSEFAGDPGFRRRFEQEVATAQRVQGVYTAPVIDANTRAEQPWLATAYVPGPSLQQAVGVYGPLPKESVLVLVAGVAEALQSIHGAGIVHRDLKPSNVILAADGPRVIDFGIARAVDTTSVTQTGLRVGTPAFMAPEQVRGQQITPAIDIFALGALACYAATGELPFGGGLDPAVPHRILEEEPDLANCPAGPREVASRCLAKDPRQRPSPAQVIELCRQASTGTRLQMGEGWLPPSVAAAVQRIATTPVPPPPPPPNRRRRLVVAAAIGVAVLAAGIAGVALAGAFRPTASSGPGPSTTVERVTSSRPPQTTTSTPSTPTTTQPPGTTTPAGDALPTFSPSAEAIASNGTAKLDLRFNTDLDLFNWKAVDSFAGGGIAFTKDGLAGQRGTQFALLKDGADTSFGSCRAQTAWATAITWSQVHRGSFACLRMSTGQRGVLRVDTMPDLEVNQPETVLTGSVWQKFVG